MNPKMDGAPKFAVLNSQAVGNKTHRTVRDRDRDMNHDMKSWLVQLDGILFFLAYEIIPNMGSSLVGG